MMLHRRLWIAAILAIVAMLGALLAAAVPSAGHSTRLSPLEAFQLAQKGRVLLIDIRTPEEWRATGIPVDAEALDMLDSSFFAKLGALTKGSKSTPVALICASGGRSSRLARTLRADGYSNVYDVSGGVTGSLTHRGWLAAGLPIRHLPSL